MELETLMDKELEMVTVEPEVRKTRLQELTLLYVILNEKLDNILEKINKRKGK